MAGNTPATSAAGSRPRSSTTRYARVTGFTLVELLVVMAIIALLVAMIVPSLAKARVAALNIKCQSNQRQLAIGAVTYGGDNRNLYLPPHRRDHDIKPGYPEYSVPQDGLVVKGYISRRSNVWMCPFLEGKKLLKTSFGIRLYGYATTYLHGTYFASTPRTNNYGPYREDELIDPSNTILFGDMPVWRYGEGDPSPAGNYYGAHIPISGSGDNRTFGNQQTRPNTWKPGAWTHTTGTFFAMWDAHVEFEDYTKYDWTIINKSLRRTQVRMRANPKLGDGVPFH